MHAAGRRARLLFLGAARAGYPRGASGHSRHHHARTKGHTARPRDRRAHSRGAACPALHAGSARRRGRRQRNANQEIRNGQRPRRCINALAHRRRARSPGRRVLSVADQWRSPSSVTSPKHVHRWRGSRSASRSRCVRMSARASRRSANRCSASSARAVVLYGQVSGGLLRRLVQALPRGVLRDFDREHPEICGASSPSFFVWSFFRLCRSPLAFDASLFVNCCEFHPGDTP